MRRREAALLLVSSAVLAYQVVLVRAFSIGQWYHFAYMVISIALLGFGASGTWIAALSRRRGASQTQSLLHEPRIAGWFALSSALFALALPVSFWLAQKIPFEPYLIIWDRRQLVLLACYYLALFVPFLAAAAAIGLALISEPEQSARLYFYNLVGSGAGAALAVAFLAVARVEAAVLAVGALATGGAVFALLDLAESPEATERRRRWVAAGVLVLALWTLLFVWHPPAVRLSPYKGLSYALNLPEAKLVAERWGPLAQVDVVSSRAIRIAPGLSLLTPLEAATPPQLGLFLDAESAGAITAFDGDTQKLEFLDWMTTAAPYFARASNARELRVCVLGAGGGGSVLLALRHAASHVDAVELDPNVINLMRRTFRDFSGRLYDRPEVQVHRAEARAFAEASADRWDVLDLSLVDSFAAAAVGVGAVAESYLYTREAFVTYLRHLRPGGLVAATRWVRMPPRDELKLFATAVAALEQLHRSPADRLVLLRSWATSTLLVKNEPFSAAEIASLRRWAEERLFDLAYFPGIQPGEGNRFNVLDRDEYAEGTAAILAGGARREQYFRDYAFYLRPATDERPYFFHFFRWRALPLMLRTVGASWIPFVEWGYLILIATLLQAALLGALLIALPLALLRPSRRAMRQTAKRVGRGLRVQVFFYFLALGLGYLFLEMVLIQRLVFFLANPIYAVAVVLAGLLIISGLGSNWAGKRLQAGASGARLACAAALCVAAIALVYAGVLRPALGPLLGLPLAARVAVALATMLPLAAMGMPFPLGLRELGRRNAELLSWAWAINGCASVVATSLATLLALTAGLTSVLVAAAACYLAAAFIAAQWHSTTSTERGSQ